MEVNRFDVLLVALEPTTGREIKKTLGHLSASTADRLTGVLLEMFQK